MKAWRRDCVGVSLKGCRLDGGALGPSVMSGRADRLAGGKERRGGNSSREQLTDETPETSCAPGDELLQKSIQCKLLQREDAPSDAFDCQGTRRVAD